MAENIISQLQNLLKNTKLNDLIKQINVATDGDGKKDGNLLSLNKVLNMIKSLQGGKLLGKLGKMAGLPSLAGAASKFQSSPENTDEQENKLDELDCMVAVAIEDGVISDEEAKMLSQKAADLGLDVEQFMSEVRAKC